MVCCVVVPAFTHVLMCVHVLCHFRATLLKATYNTVSTPCVASRKSLLTMAFCRGSRIGFKAFSSGWHPHPRSKGSYEQNHPYLFR